MGISRASNKLFLEIQLSLKGSCFFSGARFFCPAPAVSVNQSVESGLNHSVQAPNKPINIALKPVELNGSRLQRFSK